MTSHPIGNLLRYVQRYRVLFWLSVTSSICNKVLDLMPPLLVGWVIDSVRGEPPGWILEVLPTGVEPATMAAFLAGLGVVIFGFESLFEWGFQSGFMRVAQNAQHDLRVDTYDSVQRREMAFFERHRLGETMSMLNDDVNQLERFLNTGFNNLLQLLVLFLFCGAILMSTSWQLALVGLIPVPLIVLGSFGYQRLISPRYQVVRERVGSLASRLENNLSGMMVIKSFTAEDFESERVREVSDSYRQANTEAIRLSSVYVPLIRMAIAIGFGGVLWLGSKWVLEGKDWLTVGELVLFSMMIQRMLWPLTRLGVTLDEYERAKAAARRTFTLMTTESEIRDRPDLRVPESVSGELRFDNLSFRYGDAGDVIANLTATIEAGKVIGIAGTTGAGKSTLVKLLLRLYEPSDGHIYLGDQELRDIPLKELRRAVALVSQEVYLFHGTIFENIAYAQPDASIEDVRRAARLAEFDAFASSLPEQYQTLVGERGIRLSGGQRQRLSLARAILKDSPIVVLDEATSAVDNETERAIQQNLSKITQGKTALIVAHRLSTIRHADEIWVLEKGRIVERGSHDALLEQGGRYLDLWRVQSGEVGRSI
ncbi:MAG: ABC transporter ATP-binding protein [Myxococcota bacterium]|nr:ABC transporter ATP-binding protein [Myxococcota bacterium]